MKLIPSKKHAIFLAGMILVSGVVDFFPSFGPPFFRYTGSDPSHHVWNLGWPIAWSIYDKDTFPYCFLTPVLLPALLVIQSLAFLGCWLLPLAASRKLPK